MAFARALARRCDHHFGERVLGIYLIGSLAHGGFSPRYSDIDLALVVRDQLSADDLALIRDEAVAESGLFARMLSLFWSDRAFRIGRFPPLDQVDLIDHALTAARAGAGAAGAADTAADPVVFARRAAASNDDAVAFLENRADITLDLDLMKRALRCRNQGCDADALFAERSKLPAQQDAVLTYVHRAE